MLAIFLMTSMVLVLVFEDIEGFDDHDHNSKSGISLLIIMGYGFRYGV